MYKSRQCVFQGSKLNKDKISVSVKRALAHQAKKGMKHAECPDEHKSLR